MPQISLQHRIATEIYSITRSNVLREEQISLAWTRALPETRKRYLDGADKVIEMIEEELYPKK